MEMPSWEDTGLGTMKRAGLWLVQTVGVGNTFNKIDLRDAFPDVSQIDRRMRDLRDHGWRIDTNREDVSLGSNEQRFVQQGEPVWEPGRATRRAAATITAAQRHELLVKDGHMCRSCGIGPGENYAGTYVASQLDVARREVTLPSGAVEVQMVIECNRCRVGGRGLTADLGEVLNRIGRLPSFERQILAQWVDKDARPFSELESLWAAYRTLPAESRSAVRESLG
jgi:hypothetical protein